MGEEDDYMGDLSAFIPSQPHESSSRPQVFSSRSELPLNKQERRKVKREHKEERRKVRRVQNQIEEDQQTIENMEKAIPESSIGFKLLKQMGYTPGLALGKEGCGLAEPVKFEIRRGRGGIGKEDPKIEKMRREREKIERDKMNQEDLVADFESRQKERWKGKRTIFNFRKGETALAQLENREVEEKADKDQEKEEEEEEITEEDLHAILMRLRDEHLYCLFCGCQYECKDALLSNCPGIDEDDH